ncbi:MAG: FtsX-like permease family protein [Gemmatimonadetes bacterium]|nr:FtsX-like permease family protein [Gemmatimonadota bacterium]
MWKTNLIIALRVLGRNKTISLINIIGLSVAFAVAVLCLLFVRHETSFDTWHEKGDRIFAIYNERLEPESGASFNRSTIKGYRLGEGVGAKVSGIRESVFMKLGSGEVSYGDVTFDKSFLAVDPAFLTMFTLPLAAGDAATALDDSQSVVLSHETAQKYFSPDVPTHALLGKRIRLHTVVRDYSTSPLKETPLEVECTITGVLAPLPGPSILRRDVLVPVATAETLHFRGLEGLFVELEEGVEPAEVETRLASLTSRDRLKLQPFVGAHLGPKIMGPVILGYGSAEQIYLLAGLAALVLLIAAINFVNLAMSRAMTRTLEIGVRKVIGATRNQLSHQFLAEAIAVSLIAIVVGMGLAEILLPTFNEVMHQQLMHRQLEIEWLSVETGIGALTLALVVGVLSGLYPAQVVARLHPVRALSQKTPQSGHGVLGRGLIVVQFALSAVLVVVTITMARQLDFMRTKDLGFDGDQVALMGYEGFIEALQIERLANEINSRPGLVQGVTGASVAPGFGSPGLRLIQSDENELHVRPFYVSPNFLSVMGIEVLAGRGFDPNLPHSVLLNETAVRFFGPEDMIGRTLTFSEGDGEPVTVIGIVEDFHFVNMRHTIGPTFLTTFMPNLELQEPRFSHTLFRLDRADLPAAVEEVKALWKRVLPEYELHELHSVRFLDEAFAARYETEQRVGVVMGWMSAVAIAISCMGLSGLVALAAVRRTKEIGIRKVLGATTGSVLLLMSREFGWLVVVANAIAWPVAYFVLNRWLAFYAYRIDIGLEWFVVAGVGVLAVALATVSSQTWLAARTNPADALRYE